MADWDIRIDDPITMDSIEISLSGLRSQLEKAGLHIVTSADKKVLDRVEGLDDSALSCLRQQGLVSLALLAEDEQERRNSPKA